jgi:hypothetical protein
MHYRHSSFSYLFAGGFGLDSVLVENPTGAVSCPEFEAAWPIPNM